MLTAAVLLALGALPVGIYLWREHKLDTPSLQWPVLAGVLNLSYQAGPPRLDGMWTGRRVRFEALEPSGVRLRALLRAPTRLRVECGPAEEVARRSGVVVPDPVAPLHPDFKSRLLARCSDKAAGSVVFDEAMQHRLAGLPQVELLGQGSEVVWRLPGLRDPDTAEAVLQAACAVADALESFPAAGAPRA